MRWELLDRYLADSCDSEELEEIERWLAESAGHRLVLEQIARALEQSPPEARDAVRGRLERQLGLERESKSVPYPSKPTARARAKKSPPSSRKANTKGSAKVAKPLKTNESTTGPARKKRGRDKKKPG